LPEGGENSLSFSSSSTIVHPISFGGSKILKKFNHRSLFCQAAP
jgi:hypothetical protein